MLKVIVLNVIIQSVIMPSADIVKLSIKDSQYSNTRLLRVSLC
jgi:hypothetical protein